MDKGLKDFSWLNVLITAHHSVVQVLRRDSQHGHQALDSREPFAPPFILGQSTQVNADAPPYGHPLLVLAQTVQPCRIFGMGVNSKSPGGLAPSWPLQ